MGGGHFDIIDSLRDILTNGTSLQTRKYLDSQRKRLELAYSSFNFSLFNTVTYLFFKTVNNYVYILPLSINFVFYFFCIYFIDL